MKREPILILAAVNILVQAIVVLITVFWMTGLTKEQAAAINAVVAAALNLIAAFWGRSLVTPVKSSD